ncbi:MAG: hypothetical protein H0Z28_06565 [Archaeoglobus sp.]|nr:hypothetical protein [Archaeoglobus sp.]
MYKIPENLPLSVVLLAIVAKYYPRPVSYRVLLRDWTFFVPHEKAYYMMASYIRRSSHIKRVGRGEVVMNPSGWMKLAYYDKKVGLPYILKEPIETALE